MFLKNLLLCSGILVTAKANALNVGSIPILDFNREFYTLTEGFTSPTGVTVEFTNGQSLIEGLDNGRFDVILIHKDKVKNLNQVEISQTLMANGIGVFGNRDLINLINESISKRNQVEDATFRLTEVLNQSKSNFEINHLEKLEKISEFLVEKFQLDRSLVVDKGNSALKAVDSVMENGGVTLMGLHPALKNQAYVGKVATVPSSYFYVPIVAVYKSKAGAELAEYLLLPRNQKKLADIRNRKYPDIEIWKSGVEYASLVKNSSNKIEQKQLCERYTISESVPRDFQFIFAKEDNWTKVTAVADGTGKGVLKCSIKDDTVTCHPEEGDTSPALEFYLNSQDPNRQGTILRRISVGEFFIGRGGWSLKCI